MTTPFQLRAVTSGDTVDLAELGRRTFCETFAHLYRPEDLEAFLATCYNHEAIAAEIADPELEHRVLEHRGELIGFIKLGPLHLPVEDPHPNAHEIRQLYLRSDFTGQGLGQRLMDWALAHLQQRGIAHLYLSVFSENHGAIRFYEKYGFRQCGQYDFPVGTQLDLEWIMARHL